MLLSSQPQGNSIEKLRRNKEVIDPISFVCVRECFECERCQPHARFVSPVISEHTERSVFVHVTQLSLVAESHESEDVLLQGGRQLVGFLEELQVVEVVREVEQVALGRSVRSTHELLCCEVRFEKSGAYYVTNDGNARVGRTRYVQVLTLT